MKIVLLLIPFLGALAGIVLVFVFAGKSRSGQASCRGCGYAVYGLSSFTCPECGSDLREIGITPSYKGAGAGIFVAWWTLLVVIVSCPLSGLFLDAFGPRYQRRTESTALSPYSNAYKDIRIERKGRSTIFGRPQGQAPVTQAKFEVRIKDGVTFEMNIDLKTKGYSYDDGNGGRVTEPSGFDESATRDFMKAIGVNVEDEKVKAEIVELTDRILLGKARPADRPRAFRSWSSGTSSGTGSADWGYAIPVVFFLFVWAMGTWWLIRKRRKLLAAA